MRRGYARVRARLRGGEEEMLWVRAISAGSLRVSVFYVVVDKRGEFEDSPVCIDRNEIIHMHPAEIKDGELRAVV